VKHRSACIGKTGVSRHKPSTLRTLLQVLIIGGNRPQERILNAIPRCMPNPSRPPLSFHCHMRGLPDGFLELREDLFSRTFPTLANPHVHPTALKDLQDSIYREKVLRARSMTPEERLGTVFELSEFQFGLMHAGAMHKLGTDDEARGWDEV